MDKLSEAYVAFIVEKKFLPSIPPRNLNQVLKTGNPWSDSNSRSSDRHCRRTQISRPRKLLIRRFLDATYKSSVALQDKGEEGSNIWQRPVDSERLLFEQRWIALQTSGWAVPGTQRGQVTGCRRGRWITRHDSLQDALWTLCWEFIDIFDTVVRPLPAKVDAMVIEIDRSKWETESHSVVILLKNSKRYAPKLMHFYNLGSSRNQGQPIGVRSIQFASPIRSSD